MRPRLDEDTMGKSFVNDRIWVSVRYLNILLARGNLFPLLIEIFVVRDIVNGVLGSLDSWSKSSVSRVAERQTEETSNFLR